jgi:FkbM family methyltransferase
MSIPEIETLSEFHYTTLAIPSEFRLKLKSIETIPNGRMLYPENDSIMAPAIEKTGYWEKEEGLWLLEHIKPGMVFLNIGANVGYHSILVSTNITNVEVIAIEPNPIAAAILNMNLEICKAEVVVLNFAIGKETTKVSLFLDKNNFGDARIQKFTGSYLITDVQMFSIEDLFRQVPKPDVILMDIQGTELSILKDLFDFAGKKCRIIFEFSPYEINSNLNIAIEIFEKRTQGLDLFLLIGPKETKTDSKMIKELFLKSNRENVNILACIN